jgi:hypothetical protein
VIRLSIWQQVPSEKQQASVETVPEAHAVEHEIPEVQTPLSTVLHPVCVVT